MSSVNSDEYGADEFDRDLAAGQPVELVVNVKRVPRGPTPLYTVSSGRGSRVANAALKSSQGYPSEPTSFRQGVSRQGRLARGGPS